MTLKNDTNENYYDWSNYQFSVLPNFEPSVIDETKTNTNNGVY